MWQMMLLWGVLILALVWFIRDEQRRRDLRERLMAAVRIVPQRQAYDRPMPAPKVSPYPVRKPVLNDAALKLVSQLGQLDRDA